MPIIKSVLLSAILLLTLSPARSACNRVLAADEVADLNALVSRFRKDKKVVSLVIYDVSSDTKCLKKAIDAYFKGRGFGTIFAYVNDGRTHDLGARGWKTDGLTVEIADPQ